MNDHLFVQVQSTISVINIRPPPSGIMVSGPLTQAIKVWFVQRLLSKGLVNNIFTAGFDFMLWLET